MALCWLAFGHQLSSCRQQTASCAHQGLASQVYRRDVTKTKKKKKTFGPQVPRIKSVKKDGK